MPIVDFTQYVRFSDSQVRALSCLAKAETSTDAIRAGHAGGCACYKFKTGTLRTVTSLVGPGFVWIVAHNAEDGGILVSLTDLGRKMILMNGGEASVRMKKPVGEYDLAGAKKRK